MPVFNDASDNTRETKREMKDLPDEVVDSDGVADLPDEIGLEDFEKDNNSANGDVSGADNEVAETVETDVEKKGLTDEEKEKIKEETGWSDEVINHIENMDQYEIYKNAGLHEEEVDGRDCLLKDIDMDFVDPKTGMTNRELMKNGRPPIDAETGEKIELHHMGQDYDSPFAELCENSEHGDGNDTILHEKGIESWRRDPQLKNRYNNTDRPNHWIERERNSNG